MCFYVAQFLWFKTNEKIRRFSFEDLCRCLHIIPPPADFSRKTSQTIHSPLRQRSTNRNYSTITSEHMSRRKRCSRRIPLFLLVTLMSDEAVIEIETRGESDERHSNACVVVSFLRKDDGM